MTGSPKHLAYIDIEPVLEKLGDDLVRKIVLVGGQALNFWAERYVSADRALAREAPFTSKDVDFQGGKSAVILCAERLHGQHRLPSIDDVTPNAGIVLFVDDDGQNRTIDFIEQPFGLEAADVVKTAFPARFVDERRRATGAQIMVMHPVLCMKSRICNTMGLHEYQTRHGLKQARVSVLCVREFLRERISLGDVRAVGKMNEEIFRFATKHRHGKEIAAAYGIEPFEAVLVDEKLPESFRTKRYPQMKAIVEAQRRRQVADRR